MIMNTDNILKEHTNLINDSTIDDIVAGVTNYDTITVDTENIATDNKVDLDYVINIIKNFKPKTEYPLYEEYIAQTLLKTYCHLETASKVELNKELENIDKQIQDYFSLEKVKIDAFINSISIEREKYLVNGTCGLVNMGNTCFLNVVLQILKSIPLFNTYFFKDTYDVPLKYNISQEIMNSTDNSSVTETGTLVINENMFKEIKDQKISYHIGNIVKSLWQKAKLVKPVSLYKLIGTKNELFAIKEQHDSQELLNYLIDTIHEETKMHNEIIVNTYCNKYQNFINYNKLRNDSINYGLCDNFMNYWKNYINNNCSISTEYLTGVYTTYICCKECNHQKIVYESFTSLQLSVPSCDNSLNIYDLLENFSSIEEMTGDNKYECTKCSKKTDACKISYISLLPKILIIQLKRFEYDVKAQNLKKISTPIVFPLENLTLSSVVDPLCNMNFLNKNSCETYNLCGIIKHIGSTIQSGHYVCYCKNTENNGWYYYNDENVTFVDTDTVVESNLKNSYMLFYHLSKK